MMLKYKVGDKVVVRNDIVRGKRWYMDNKKSSNTITKDMMELKGKVVTIRYTDTQYAILEDLSNRWTDEMFEGLAREENEI